ncbi:Acyl-CoA-binding domain-containing protein 1 [Acorus gramineus]|uniref:Acyl-CoA-binding domain-containing protein 1 n=1 Tax=Acorus gramineus TaxID=55184 RepID=A0AAV9BC64_ACOGR|nr:Acyl-CoA-binding domain-containing protein 1 [Acorus gramineus]
MEFFTELLLTVAFSLLFAIVLSKLVALASDGDSIDQDRGFGGEASVIGGSNEGSVEERLRTDEQEAMVSEREGLDENRRSDLGIEETETEEGDGEDEWEEIERSELEERFREAAAASVNESVLSKLSRDLQLRLYGLRKIATEGPCHEPRPMALMVAARAKWHAWQRLGNMNPELAMEQYLILLLENIPGWTGEKLKGEKKIEERSGSREAGASGVPEPDASSTMQQTPRSENERITELQCHDGRDERTGDSVSLEYVEPGYLISSSHPYR